MSQALNRSFLDKMDKILERLTSLNTGTMSLLVLCMTLNKVTFLTGLDGYLSSVDLRSLILGKFKIHLKHTGSLFQSKFIFFKLK